MIVKREYVRLGKLFETDKEAERVFMAAAEKSYAIEDRERILKTLLQFSLCEREMGWCLHDVGAILARFDELDKEQPYETGMLPHETVNVKIVQWNYKSIIVKLLSGDGETIGVKRIRD